MISLISSLALSAVVAILLNDNMALSEEDSILLFVALFLFLYTVLSTITRLFELFKSAKKLELDDKWAYVGSRLLSSAGQHATVLVAGAVTVALMTSYLMSADSAAISAGSKTAATGAVTAVATAVPVSAPQKTTIAPISTVGPFVRKWAKAWETGQTDLYLSMYSPQFTPSDGIPRSDWEKKRRLRVSNAKNITIEIVDLQVTPLGLIRAEAVFTQHYTATGHKDVTQKTLTMQYADGQWLLLTERVDASVQ